MTAQTSVAIQPNDVEDKVVSCIRKLLPRGKSKQPISTASRLRWELGLDSMQLLELTFLLEEEFRWRNANYEQAGEPIETVGDVVRFVSRLLGVAGAEKG
ncbi:MAG TPA: phosphopantetheine-binding protein [Polyangiaceae bacterium]|nr:phosphopantetheine-binding protein [Polyangiaceae bacterium]